MNLAAVEICQLDIPFRFRYGHASAQHHHVQSIVCIARDADGLEGYGEAVPRSYVTGESVESVRLVLPMLISELLSPGSSLETFRNAIGTFENRQPSSIPACALCALDTAVTDLVARQRAQSVTDLLGGAAKSPLSYTASIGISSPAKLTALLLLYRAMGLRSFKVKLSGDAEADQRRLHRIRRILGPDVTLFADANGAWNRDTAARRIEQLHSHDIWAIEEPLRISMDRHPNREAALTDSHFSDCAWLQARSSIPLIADESLISLRGAKTIIESGAFQIFNIRLSKCGGYHRASQFADLARQAGLSFSVGAMVGESPILAAAGAAWAASQPEHRYVQGHSHRLLHGRRFVEGCPRLKRGGIFEPNAAPGSGLTLDRAALAGIIRNQQSVVVE